MKKEKEQKRIFYVEYKDGGDYGCAEEVEVYDSECWLKERGVSHMGEKIAVMKVTQTLLDEHDYMSKLIEVYEITPEVAIHDEEETFYDYGKDEPVWSIKNGPELDQEDQDTLNYAFESMVNKDGLTMKEAIDKKNK